MIIGITGNAGHGKDTVAAYLCRQLPGVVLHGSYAWPIKAALSKMFPSIDLISRGSKETPRELLGGRSPREAMQHFGSWAREFLGEDVFVNSLRSRLHGEAYNYLIISDVRYDNEARWIKSEDGIILKVVRPGIPSVAAHESEHGILLDFIDRTVYNDGSIEQLYRRLDDEIRGL